MTEQIQNIDRTSQQKIISRPSSAITYCPKLFRDINFEPNALTPCCNTRSLVIPAFPYHGGSIDLEAYGKHILKTINDIQQNKPVCKNCPELITATLPDQLNCKFKSISLNMHRHYCNCCCVYCSLWDVSSKTAPYDPLPGLISLHEQKAISENAFISWGGGESSILPTFEQTAEWALSNNYRQNIHTNAIRYSPAIYKLLELGRGTVNISLDSATPKIYKAVKGADAFKKVMATLEKYAQANSGNVILKYIVFEKNNDKIEIDNFLKLAKSLNVGLVEVSLNFLELNSNTVSNKTLMGVAWFMTRARQLEIPYVTFFIDPQWQKKINVFIRMLSGR